MSSLPYFLSSPPLAAGEAPAVEDVQPGELVINRADGRIFFKIGVGNDVRLASITLDRTFLDPIPGPQGVQGIKGDKGDRGDKGDKGDKGEFGPPLRVRAATNWSQINNFQPFQDNDTFILNDATGAPASIFGLASPGDAVVYSQEEWINVGPVRGPQGLQGPPGLNGVQGPQGEQTLWLTGTEEPDDSLGRDFDLYLNKTNGDVYGPKSDGTWGDPVANLTGPPGPTIDLIDALNSNRTDAAATANTVRLLNERINSVEATAQSSLTSARRINTELGIDGGGSLATDLTLRLSNTGVTAGIYGNNIQVPTLNIDARGRVLSASNTSIRQATTLQPGIVQLNNLINSTSVTTAATASAVKRAYDLADSAAPKTRQIITGKGLLGGGNLNQDLTLAARTSTQQEAEDGDTDLSLMTPLSTKQAIISHAIVKRTSRSSFILTLPSLSIDEDFLGTAQLGKLFWLFSVAVSSPLRLRLYKDLSSQIADQGRPISTPATYQNGVIIDVETGAPNQTITFTPPIVGYNDDEPEQDLVYYTATKLASTGTSVVDINFLQLFQA